MTTQRRSTMGWRMRVLLILGVSVTGGIAVARAGDPSAPGKGPYLGQKAPGMTAEIFAPGLVSSRSFEHGRLEISKDGTALYWVVQPARGKQFIWTTRRGPDGSWSKPAALPLSKGADALPFLASPALAPDGKKLYFFSTDRATETKTLYAVDLENPRWDAPISVSALLPDLGAVWVFSFAANGNLYFDSNRKLFTMEYRDGRYGPPVKLGHGINDGEVDFLPFPASDESYLLFSSGRNGSVGGFDLYVSFRNVDGGWGSPKNLGPAVNTPVHERFPSVSPDGKYLFFLRNDPAGDADIYWVDAAVIEQAR
jgi:hypothetical protein